MSDALIRRAIGWPMLTVKRRHLQQFLAATADVETAQYGYLQRYLTWIAGSRLAKDHGLSPGMSVEAFRQACPVNEYDDLRPYIDDVFQGDQQAMFHPSMPLDMFALTSGTTSAAKYIPVTRQAFTEYRTSWTIWAVQVALDYPLMPYGGVISLTSGWQTGTSPGGTPVGSITGFLHRAMHGILRFSNAVPPPVSGIDKFRERYYISLLCSLRRTDVRMVNAANPTTLLLFARLLAEFREQLIRDIAQGTVSIGKKDCEQLSAPMRLWLGTKLRGRAAELEKLPEFRPVDVWPGLELLGVWTGGTLQNYLSILPRYYGDLPFRDHGLSASEGRVTIPLEDGTSSGLLNIGGGFFEFIPQGEEEAVSPKTLLPHQLAVGDKYFVVMTTSGGLARYHLADLVECTGFQGTTPLLKFLNKSRQFSNLTGEKLAACQVSAALRRIGETFSLEPAALVPVPGDPAGYVLWHEPMARMEELVARLDGELQAANIEYRDKRASGRLQPVRAIECAVGTFDELRRRQIAERGSTLEQYKQPCLFPSAEEAASHGFSLPT